MSRIQQLFQHKKNNILNIYCTAGYPNLNSTLPIIEALEKSGADIVELGMPYSDPLADGETIQNSATQALQNGMTIKRLFEQLQPLRPQLSIPVVLMGYMNPVLQYGFERFCADAADVGVDALILPDMPVREYETHYKAIVEKYQLDFVFLVTPETSEQRVKSLDGLSSGFLYAVSSSSTTGIQKDFSLVEAYLQRIQTYQLKNPVLVGFGISDKESFNSACKYANGAIIGSAFIKALAHTNNESDTTQQFVTAVLA